MSQNLSQQNLSADPPGSPDEEQKGYTGMDLRRLSKRNRLFVSFVIFILVCIVAYMVLRTQTPYSDHAFSVQGRAVRLVLGSQGDHETLLRAAQLELERVFNRFSFFSPESETTRLNRISETNRKTDAETYAFLTKLEDLSEKTLWHYDFTIGIHYRPYALFELPTLETYRYPTDLNLEDGSVHSDHPFLFFFGKAVKGYALDCVYESIRKTDPKATGHCEIDGDIRFFGPKAGGADWIAGGWNNQELYLSSGALFHHPTLTPPEGTAAYEDHLLLSPDKGEPIKPIEYAAVIAPTALEAACFVVAAQTLDSEILFQTLSRIGAAAYLITDGKAHYSTRWTLYTYVR